MSTPVELVLSRLPNATQSGNGWQSPCPAHEDRRPSLSIGEGDDGRALIHCHAGCTVEAVCEALGLQVADLMPVDSSTVSPYPKHAKGPKNAGVSETRPRTKGRVYPDRAAALAAVAQQIGCEPAAVWLYHTADGREVSAVARFDLPDGKTYRPVSRNGDGWHVGGMAEPRPLYGLPTLADAQRVYVCEGEKTADAARSIGLKSTTSAHGSQSPDKTDWTPLAGKEVVILPDADQAGRQYADAVSQILGRLSPAPIVKQVELPGLPEHGDLVDYLESHDAVEPEALQEQIETLADAAPVWTSERPEPTLSTWKPFPLESLPEPVRGFVAAGAQAIGCDPSYIALPMLAGLASAIGNSRRIELKRGWTEPAILWACIVGNSGNSKSPALELALRPARQRQGAALRGHAEQMQAYENETLRYERELARWKQSKTDGDPPEKPEEPALERCWSDDTTTEALAALLLENWRG